MRILVLLLCWLPFSLWAANFIKSEITYDEEADRYSLTAEILIDAPKPVVLAILTDYKNLSNVSALITESTILKQYSPHHHRIRLVSNKCILFFCTDIIRIQDIKVINGQRIEAIIIPEQSNFKQASSIWILQAENETTLIQYKTQSIPDFWVPPLIGPWFFKSAMYDSVMEMAAGIERIANEKQNNEH